MIDKDKILDIENEVNLTEHVLQNLNHFYYSVLYQVLKVTPELKETFTGFLLGHSSIKLYISKTHLGVEYFGPVKLDQLKSGHEANYRFEDFSRTDENMLELIVGFGSDATSGINMPLVSFTSDLFLPTNKGSDKLIELGWNFDAQPAIIGFNAGFPVPKKGEFHRIINSYFFDANENGLKTRHIQWLDLIPIEYDEDEKDSLFGIDFSFLPELAIQDAHFQYPIIKGFKAEKMPQINRFIELISDKSNSEPTITQFLSKKENAFILSMFCQGVKLYPEVLCEWNNGEERQDIKPDFLIQKADGFSDIVEFKLPYLKSTSVVGRENREGVSSEINSYISQVRTYMKYFEDKQNRNWLMKNKNINVNRPKVTIILGRRSDFLSEEWRDIINMYKDIDIKTYDDLIDTITCQFYL